ncbi:hypothetical protein BGZ72_000061, partial [Mortierella alpina]
MPLISTILVWIAKMNIFFSSAPIPAISDPPSTPESPQRFNETVSSRATQWAANYNQTCVEKCQSKYEDSMFWCDEQYKGNYRYHMACKGPTESQRADCRTECGQQLQTCIADSRLPLPEEFWDCRHEPLHSISICVKPILDRTVERESECRLMYDILPPTVNRRSSCQVAKMRHSEGIARCKLASPKNVRVVHERIYFRLLTMNCK